MKITTLLITLVISSTAFGYKFASPSEPSAKIIMNHSSNAKQLFPMKLLMVNGENVSVRSEAVWLAPGEYELKFASAVNNNYAHQNLSLKERRLNNDNNTLKIKVDAGKSYYVAYDASSTEAKEWQPVIFDVK